LGEDVNGTFLKGEDGKKTPRKKSNIGKTDHKGTSEGQYSPVLIRIV
jgi:hypothetical protein